MMHDMRTLDLPDMEHAPDGKQAAPAWSWRPARTAGRLTAAQGCTRSARLPAWVYRLHGCVGCMGVGAACVHGYSSDTNERDRTHGLRSLLGMHSVRSCHGAACALAGIYSEPS
jgi:hypothetical protein